MNRLRNMISLLLKQERRDEVARQRRNKNGTIYIIRKNQEGGYEKLVQETRPDEGSV